MRSAKQGEELYRMSNLNGSTDKKKMKTYMKDLISIKLPVFISNSSTVKIFMIPFLNFSEKIVSSWTFTYLLNY